jgi:beta-phosphoglucomutase-like phosphatase (HAD superfamily)
MANSLDATIKIKAVALDFDGVITNLDVDWNDAIRQASKIAGYDIKSLILFYENNFQTPLFYKISSEIEKIESNAVKTVTLKPFTREFLQKIRDAHIDAFIVSMQSSKVIQTFLNEHDLAGYFKDVITRERCPSKKAQVSLIAKENGLSPRQILLVDDSKRNVSLCRDLGIACFLFDREQNQKGNLKAWSKVLSLLKIDNSSDTALQGQV